MADSSQRTEKPTPQRLKKAREKGDFPSAREFVGAVQFFAFVMLAGAYFSSWLVTLQYMLREGLRQAFRASLTAADLMHMIWRLAAPALVPLAILGGILMALTLLLQMVATNFGFTFARLAPQFERLNPSSRLSQLPGTNMGNFFQALVMIPVMFWMTWSLVSGRMMDVLRLPMMPVSASASVAGMLIHDALKKSSFVLVMLGSVMLIRERSRYSKRLRMSKQEIRDEHKDTEGNPQIKARVRRLQRDLRRRNMMREVPTATAIVVNPTHYAVALKYDQGSMVAPQVVAKGKNYLAARIRQRAIENQVPIIENPPLAQALYKAVDVGQDIPPHLYRAVAEILAYIFKLMNPAYAKQAARRSK